MNSIKTSVITLTAGALIMGGAPVVNAHANTLDSTSRQLLGADIAADQGKDILRGVLFLQGEVGARVLQTSQFDEFSAEQKAELAQMANQPRAVAVMDQVIREAELASPGFLNRFARSMTSGSPVKVQAALNDAVSRIQKSPTYVAGVKSKRQVSTYIPGEAGTDCWVAVVVAAGAVIVVAAIAAANAVFAANWAVGYNVAAGTNVYYQSNYTRTRSIGAKDAPADEAYAADLALLLAR